MQVLYWIGVGLIGGWYSGMLIGNGYGLLSDIALGAIGGLLGGYLANALFGVPEPGSGLNLFSIAIAFVGTMTMIGITRLVIPRRVIMQSPTRATHLTSISHQ